MNVHKVYSSLHNPRICTHIRLVIFCEFRCNTALHTISITLFRCLWSLWCLPSSRTSLHEKEDSKQTLYYLACLHGTVGQNLLSKRSLYQQWIIKSRCVWCDLVSISLGKLSYILLGAAPTWQYSSNSSDPSSQSRLYKHLKK